MKMFVKLCFSLHFIPLDPDPRTQMNADPTGSTSLMLRKFIYLEKDREVAKRLLKEGKKDRAKLLLRKKKYQVSSRTVTLFLSLPYHTSSTCTGTPRSAVV